MKAIENQVKTLSLSEKEEIEDKLKDWDLSPKSKLKLAIPIIPMILEWKTELEMSLL